MPGQPAFWAGLSKANTTHAGVGKFKKGKIGLSLSNVCWSVRHDRGAGIQLHLQLCEQVSKLCVSEYLSVVFPLSTVNIK